MVLIPKELYEKITASIPIPGVEAMMINDGALLLMKRNNDPAKGMWWFPGGRIRRGETFEEALKREVTEETHINFEITRLIGVYNRIFPGRHDVSIVYLCKATGTKIKLNKEHSEYHFFRKLPRLHPYLLEVINDSLGHVPTYLSK